MKFRITGASVRLMKVIGGCASIAWQWLSITGADKMQLDRTERSIEKAGKLPFFRSCKKGKFQRNPGYDRCVCIADKGVSAWGI